MSLFEWCYCCWWNTPLDSPRIMHLDSPRNMPLDSPLDVKEEINEKPDPKKWWKTGEGNIRETTTLLRKRNDITLDVNDENWDIV